MRNAPDGSAKRPDRSIADPSGVPPYFSEAEATETDPLLGPLAVDEVRQNAEEIVDKMFQRHKVLQMVFATIMEWVVFTFAVLVVIHAHHPDQGVRAAAICAIAAAFLLGFFISSQYKMFRLLSVLCLEGVLGALAGGWAWSCGAIDYWSYGEHWQYTNVWPTELAAAHRDASALVFAQGAAPDLMKSASYAVGGHTYCVAPIAMSTSDLEVPDVQYWAAGRDCCVDAQGAGDKHFACDDAGKQGARAGLVLRSHTQEAEYFNEAAHRAKAQFNIVSTTEQPIFVRWVLDLEAGRMDFWRRTLAVAFELILLYLVLKILAAGTFRIVPQLMKGLG